MGHAKGAADESQNFIGSGNDILVMFIPCYIVADYQPQILACVIP